MRGSMLAFAGTLLAAMVGCKADRVAQKDAVVRPDPCNTPILEPRRVSIVALIASPERYEGQAVVVTGFYKTGFEHSALYLHQDDGEHAIRANGFWLEGGLPDHMRDRYMTVQGIFTTTTRGHLGRWPGTLCGASAVG